MAYETRTITIERIAYDALATAVALGAFAARQETLRTLIAHNTGTQTGDTYERELAALERGVYHFTHPEN